MPELTTEEEDALCTIKYGADIFCIKLARTLRVIEKKYPELLQIVEPMGIYDIKQKHPYFGAICTAKGQNAIRLCN